MLLTKTPLALENYTLTECLHKHSRNNNLETTITWDWRATSTVQRLEKNVRD